MVGLHNHVVHNLRLELRAYDLRPEKYTVLAAKK